MPFTAQMLPFTETFKGVDVSTKKRPREFFRDLIFVISNAVKMRVQLGILKYGIRSADCTILELNHKGKLSTRLCSALCRDYPRDNGIIKGVNDLTIANIILLGKDELLKTKGIGRTLYWELVTLLCKDFGENIENWKPNSNTNPYLCNLNKFKDKHKK